MTHINQAEEYVNNKKEETDPALGEILDSLILGAAGKEYHI